ncbi:MAG TPA: hypothetical protein DEG76_08685, partial [Pseudohongiella sp.]|nr:hypothetical protein [Pseudohongiella sp.]
MIRRSLYTLAVAALVSLLAMPASVLAQPNILPAEPFKVGTFVVGNQQFSGLIMRDDSLIVDLVEANKALELMPEYPSIDMPDDVLGLIEGYEYGLKFRVYEIVNALVDSGMLNGSDMPDYIHAVEDVDIRAPIQYPSKIMNAAVNFYTHACEGCTEEQLAQRTRERRENRGVPYLFLKPTRGAIIGDGENVIMPYGRDEIEYEVEMAIVFGRSGKYISASRAYDHVFGYMVAMDIS